MSIRNVLVSTTMIVVGAAMAGCQTTAAGTPTPQPDGSVASSTQPSSSDRLAPPVEDPKDLSGIDPCQLLTQAQLVELTFTEPGVKKTVPSGHEECTWQNSNISVGLLPDTRRDGLEAAYRNEHKFDNFEESSVNGYPAVRTDAGTQGCGVIVGVAEDQAFNLFFGRITGKDPAYQDPCGFAETVAGMVLENLPAG